jgi:hypothetical protein
MECHYETCFHLPNWQDSDVSIVDDKEHKSNYQYAIIANIVFILTIREFD